MARSALARRRPRRGRAARVLRFPNAERRAVGCAHGIGGDAERARTGLRAPRPRRDPQPRHWFHAERVALRGHLVRLGGHARRARLSSRRGGQLGTRRGHVGSTGDLSDGPSHGRQQLGSGARRAGRSRLPALPARKGSRPTRRCRHLRLFPRRPQRLRPVAGRADPTVRRSTCANCMSAARPSTCIERCGAPCRRWLASATAIRGAATWTSRSCPTPPGASCRASWPTRALA